MANANYIDLINNLKQEMFTTDQAGIVSLACAVGCIMASFALIAWYNHWQNDPWGMFDMKGVLRIVVVLALVCNFHSFVLIPFDYMTNIVTKGITSTVKEDRNAMQFKLNSAFSAVEDALSRNTMRGQFEQMLDSGTSETSLDDGASGGTNAVLESVVESDINSGKTPGFWDKVWGMLKGAVQSAMGFPYKAISTIIAWVMSCIVDFVRFILMLLSGIYMIILGLLGPFIFAISILPSYKGGISNWFARYIQFAFWVPVCSIIDYINIHLKDALLDLFARNNLVEQMVFPTVFIILLEVATLVMLLAVPSISSWVVAGDGAGAMRSIMTAAQKAAKLLVKK